MSLQRERAGYWIGDFRYAGFDRLRLSLGRWKRGGRAPAISRAEAFARHEAVAKLFRQNRRDLIAQLRLPKDDPRRLTVERLAQMVEHHEPLVPLAAPAGPTRDGWGTVREVGDRWLAWVRAHRSAGTYDTRRAQLNRFCAFEYEGRALGTYLLDEVPSAALEAYQAHLLTVAPANTVTGYMTGVGALWRWAGKRELRAAREGKRAPRALYSPLDRDTQHTKTTARDRYLTPEEATALLAATPPQLLAIVACGLLAGLRLEEALYLRRPDVDLELGLLTIAEKPLPDDSTWTPKTARSARRIPIADPLRSILARHLASPHAGAWWLTARPADVDWPWHPRVFQAHFRTIVTDAGLRAGRAASDGVTFHTLRHTFASWLVMARVDLYTVAQLLGDTLATVERTYAHLSPDFKRAAVAALAGVFSLPTELTQE